MLVVPVHVGENRKAVEAELALCVEAALGRMPERLEASDSAAISRAEVLRGDEVVVEHRWRLGDWEVDSGLRASDQVVVLRVL